MIGGLINDQNRKWIILAVGSLAFGLIMLDETVVAVSLPTMQVDLSMSVLESHWVINAYLLVIAGFIAVGGKLGDIVGYKNLFYNGSFSIRIIFTGCRFFSEFNMDTCY